MLSARPRVAIVLALAIIVAGATPARADVALGPTAAVSSPYAWTDGNAVGRTSAFVQAAWASDCPPPTGACATDSGPYVGVFWQRTALGAAPNWSRPLRVSQTQQHSDRPALAASGSNVYVAWTTRPSYINTSPTSRRVVWVRSSPNEGTSWSAPTRLSWLHGHVDFPVLAASGSDAWLSWTNRDNGVIRLASTTNDGSTWTTRTIGTTSWGAKSAAGFRGFPAVGASGGNVVVSWIANASGRVVALTSNLGGSEWGPTSTLTELLGSGPHDSGDYPAVRGADDGASTNVAVGYATADGFETRLFDGSSLGAGSRVEGPWPTTIDGRLYDGGYGPAVLPFGTEGISVAWAGCRHWFGRAKTCDSGSSKARIDVLERESTNGGATWLTVAPVSIANLVSPISEAPSLEVDGGTRWFVWLSRGAQWDHYQVFGRTGTAS